MASTTPQTRFKQIDQKLHSIEQELLFQKDTVDFDVMASCWFMLFCSPHEGQLQIWNKDHWMKIEGPSALVLPSFAIIRYKISPGRFNWIGFGSESPLYGLPNHPIFLPKAPSVRIQCFAEAEAFFATSINQIPIESRIRSSDLSNTVKNYLCKNFRGSISMANMCDDLGISYSTMTQDFKRCFGLAPSLFLKKIRMMDALHSIKVKNQSVTESCLGSGFTDVSRFGQGFKDTFGLLPSKYDNSLK